MDGLKTGLEKRVKIQIYIEIFLVHEVIQDFRFIIQCCGSGEKKD